jgi:hypothetical protein
MVVDVSPIKIECGFDADGYEKALRDYLLTECVGRPYAQEVCDEIRERAAAMVNDFVIVAEFTPAPA